MKQNSNSLSNQNLLTLFLASNSPRRKELLQKAGFEFQTYPVKVSEFLDKNLNLDEGVKQIARQKAMAAYNELILSKSHGFLVLASDTLVVLDNQVFGKPENKDQAFGFLSRLSGQTHIVKTAVTMIDSFGNQANEIESSYVTFRKLSDSEIWSYIETGDPMDKAGAYGIQSVGATFISKLEGSLDNVMGLSISLVKRMIKENGWSVHQNSI